ncbi:hypothetical protein CTEN210_00324 [Chaetoceros tenuissimus]|uniref:Uncharacterized protein n=1 Tax=Chaetoceros tenuissimus TaxID=426638 RepID=A0AAD3CFH6_9STRA|nr:hypothetical protein CTEN210_00324 [Chaetoceros tenuissimus]
MTFFGCHNIHKVFFANTVTNIELCAFMDCKNLTFVKWSLNLQLIGDFAFHNCNLSSVFLPPRCRVIRGCAFARNSNLTIFTVPQDTQVGSSIVSYSKLLERSPFGGDDAYHETNTWLKNVNNGENFALHRVCSSFRPTLQEILDTMKEKGGPKAFKVKNSIDITPSRYLKENPYAHVTEKEVIEKYILDMMGENS